MAKVLFELPGFLDLPFLAKVLFKGGPRGINIYFPKKAKVLLNLPGNLD